MAHKMGFVSCFESQSVILNIMGGGGVTGSLQGAELSTRVFPGVILGQNRYLAFCWPRLGLWHHPPRLNAGMSIFSSASAQMPADSP